MLARGSAFCCAAPDYLPRFLLQRMKDLPPIYLLTFTKHLLAWLVVVHLFVSFWATLQRIRSGQKMQENRLHTLVPQCKLFSPCRSLFSQRLQQLKHLERLPSMFQHFYYVINDVEVAVQTLLWVHFAPCLPKQLRFTFRPSGKLSMIAAQISVVLQFFRFLLDSLLVSKDFEFRPNKNF